MVIGDEGGEMSWRMTAKYYEACNCAYGCPCNMSGFPTHGKCEGAIAFEVVEGEREGVDLAGAKVASAVKWPGPIHEGNGAEVVFIDASDEQVDALLPILTADDPGLPWEILAATVSDVRGPYRERIEIEDDGINSRIRVGDKFEMDLDSFIDPVTGDEHEARMVLPTGFIFQDGRIGTTSVNRVDADGITFDHSGNNAFYADVEWSSDNRMAPMVGAGAAGGA